MKTYRIPTHSLEWFAFRRNGIGGSEIGSVLGLDKFRCGLELFHQKLGIAPKTETNAAMLFGQMLEEKVAEAWQYFDGTETGWVDRAQTRKPFRKCRRRVGYVTNARYPWLFFSPDRIIQAGQTGWRRVDGQPERFEIGKPGGYLELKCINDHHFRHDPVQLSHCAQVQAGLIAMGMEYGELAMLVGGSQLHVLPIEANAEFQEDIFQQTREFWKSVETAGLYLYGGDYGSNESARRQVDHLAPEPKESEAEAYAKYIGIAYEPADSDTLVNGSDYDLKLARKYLEINAKKGKLEKERKFIAAKFEHKIKSLGAEGLTFQNAGKITYKPDVNGKYSIHVGVK
jgi:predicted phage-related endonuclease